jgi:hypothetical protein
MIKSRFRTRWEPYFSSFTDNELFAIKFIVSEMHQKASWFTTVGRIIDAWVVLQRKDQVAEAEQLIEDATAEQPDLSEHAVH